MGVPAEYLYPRHTAAVEWRGGGEHGSMAYQAGRYLFSEEEELRRSTKLANLSGRLKPINGISTDDTDGAGTWPRNLEPRVYR